MAKDVTAMQLKARLDLLPEGQTIRVSDSGLYAYKSHGYHLSVGGCHGSLPIADRYLQAPELAIEIIQSRPTRLVV